MKKQILFVLIMAIALLKSTVNAQFTKILDFDGSIGEKPSGHLVLVGSNLYGMAELGGTNNFGTIFKFDENTYDFTKIHDFTYANGANPAGSLVFVDGSTYLYGMTNNGGTNNVGVVFKIDINTSVYTKILDFNGADNGANPIESLISDGVYLYGMTQYGGANNLGVIFKIEIATGTYTKMFDFNGTNGSTPNNTLLLVGDYLYGMTTLGGSNSYGTVFKIDKTTHDFTKLLDFSGMNGQFPRGSLVSDGSFVYGMAQAGGQNNSGVIFKINLSNGTYTKMYDFEETNGYNPKGSLILFHDDLYGMASQGGQNSNGCIFKINKTTNAYQNLHSFTYNDGTTPNGSLCKSDNFVYGMTYFGGVNDKGTIFAYELPAPILPPGNALDFDGIDDYVSIPSTSQLGFQNNSFTLECWINGNDFYVDRPIIARPDNNNSALQFLIKEAKPFIGFGVDNLQGNTELNVNESYHLAFTFDAATNTRSIYVNGELDAQDITSTSYTFDTQLAIGFSLNSYTYFNGKIDELRIWNYALEECEIKEKMNLELSGSETGLTAYYNFNQGTANGMNTSITTLFDKTPNMLNGTLNGFALDFPGFSNFVYSPADLFDELGDQFVSTSLNSIIENNVSINVSINDFGSSYAHEIGVFYNTNPCPTIIDPKEYLEGNFQICSNTIYILGLEPNTTYYARAYAINERGISFGNEISFQTLPQNNTNQLVAYYPFNGNANDESTSELVTLFNNTELTYDRFSSINSAANFNGTSQYIEIEQATPINFAGSDNFSISAWVNPAVLTQNTIYNKVSESYLSLEYNFNLEVRSDGKVYVWFGSEGVIWKIYNSIQAIPTNQWTHLVVTKNYDVVKLYINGTLDSQFIIDDTDVLNASASTVNAAIGYFRRDNALNFVGTLDDICIYNYAIPEGKIDSLYHVNGWDEPFEPSNNALDFDGQNDYVYIPNNANYSFNSDITLEAWINTTKISNNIIINDHNNAIVLAIGGDGTSASEGKVSVFLNGPSPNGWYYGNTVVSDGNWHYVVATYNGTSLNIYVDGLLNNTVSLNGNIVGYTDYFEIGASLATSNYFQGKIDELKIWNVARTESEIASHFANPNVNAYGTGLLAYYNFDHGIPGGINELIAFIFDASPISNWAGLNNFALYGNTSNFIESYAMVVPRNLYPTEVNPNGFKANWNSPIVGTAETYTLQISATSDFSNVYQTLDMIADTFYYVSGLSPMTEYFFRVRANKNSIFASGAYSPSNSVFTSSASVCNAGRDTSICSYNYQLQATDPSPMNGAWTVIQGSAQLSNYFIPNPLVTNLSKGENKFVWNVAGLMDTVTVRCAIPYDVSDIGGPTIYATNDTICLGMDVYFNVQNSQRGVLYQLRLVETPVLIPQIGNENSLLFTYTGLTENTTFSFTVTDTATGCYIELSQIIPITVIKPPVVDLGNDLTICDGNTINLMAGNNYANFYSWSTGASTPSINVSPSVNTGYSVTASNMCGSSSDAIMVFVSPASHADFTITPISANTFTFNNLTASTTNFWSFGDGKYSNEISPQYTYNQDGYYNVCLSVADIASGCNSTKCQTVQAGNSSTSCLAAFNYTIDDVRNVSFNSSPSQGNLTNFFWVFSDGSFSFQPNPEKTFNFDGIYKVTLTVRDSFSGCMNTYFEYITIGDPNADCEIDFTYYTQSPSLWAYFTVTFGLGNNYSYLWNFGDGTTSTDMYAVHNYATKGYYDVCLTAYNHNNGCSKITCKRVLVGDSTIFCFNNFTYMVDSVGSKANSYPVSYKGATFGDPAKNWNSVWDFGDGTFGFGNIETIHNYGQTGYYLVSFRINNASNTCVSTYYDLVNIFEEGGLRGDFGFEIDTNNTKANSYPVSYKGATFGDPARLNWTFGDGTSDSTTMNPTHIYTAQGTYNVCLTVEDPVTMQIHTSCRDVDVYDYTKIKENLAGETAQITIMPNPGKGQYKILVNVPETQFVSISVFDLYGKQVDNVLHQTLQQGTYDLYYNMSSEKQGVFYLRMMNGKETKVVKFIKM